MSVTIPFTLRKLTLRPIAGEAGHGKRGSKSGILACELLTRTPLCIHSLYKELRDTDVPLIPGSSLRGMLRNMLEVLGASCARLMDRPPARLPAYLKTCSPAAACPACRMMGFTDNQFSWAGKVLISDARAVPGSRWTFGNLRRQAYGQPQPAEAWVLFGRTPDSRDPYSARATGREDPRWQNFSDRGFTRCAASETRFTFRVDYLNLDAEEMSLLLFALTLRYGADRLCHKLGYSKALGLGECTISITNPNVPVTGPEIEPYLKDPAFEVVKGARKLESPS